MSGRVAKKPILIPKRVEVSIDATHVSIKGPKGSVSQAMPAAAAVEVQLEDSQLLVAPVEGAANGEALAGTIRALLNNHVHGVSEGFIIKLKLIGVGYRAQAAKMANGASKVDLTLGKSHPESFIAPLGISLVTPSQTEIEISGANRQVVGQVAADIRKFRPPEPYKGKGIRYADETIILKETKKK
jgi:large subunit ribosomal protein L6